MQGFSNGSGGQGCEGGAPGVEEGVSAPSSWEKDGNAGSFSKDTTLRRSDEAAGEGRTLSGLTVDLAAGLCFLFRNSALRLAFRLRVDGLGFFLTDARILVSKTGAPSLVSRVKQKLEPVERENLKALPWLLSAWQNSMHFDAKEESFSPTAVIFGEVLN